LRGFSGAHSVKLRGLHNFMQRRAQYRSPAPPIRIRRPNIAHNAGPNTISAVQCREYTIRHRGNKYMKKRYEEMEKAVEQCAELNRKMRRIAEKLSWTKSLAEAKRRSELNYYFGRPSFTYNMNTYPASYVIRINAGGRVTIDSTW
jgi:hypothetical protein